MSDFIFTCTKELDESLYGIPARIVSTHPLDLVKLEFIDGSKIIAHISQLTGI